MLAALKSGRPKAFLEGRQSIINELFYKSVLTPIQCGCPSARFLPHDTRCASLCAVVSFLLSHDSLKVLAPLCASLLDQAALCSQC